MNYTETGEKYQKFGYLIAEPIYKAFGMSRSLA